MAEQKSITKEELMKDLESIMAQLYRLDGIASYLKQKIAELNKEST